MTRDDVIRWAREAGLPDPMVFAIGYERLVLRAAADEREECAKVCDEVSLQASADWKLRYELQDQGREMGAEDCAAAIRARKPA